MGGEDRQQRQESERKGKTFRVGKELREGLAAGFWRGRCKRKGGGHRGDPAAGASPDPQEQEENRTAQQREPAEHGNAQRRPAVTEPEN